MKDKKHLALVVPHLVMMPLVVVCLFTHDFIVGLLLAFGGIITAITQMLAEDREEHEG